MTFVPLVCDDLFGCDAVTRVDGGGPCEMAGRKWREMAGRAIQRLIDT